jgi:hypothetical protein
VRPLSGQSQTLRQEERQAFSGFAFLDVPDENRANYGYESKCREDD